MPRRELLRNGQPAHRPIVPFKRLTVKHLTSANLTFTIPSTRGTYVLKFFAGSMLLATSQTITVAIPPAVTFNVSATDAAPLSRITATVANGPGNAGDWIGVYAAG